MRQKEKIKKEQRGRAREVEKRRDDVSDALIGGQVRLTSCKMTRLPSCGHKGNLSPTHNSGVRHTAERVDLPQQDAVAPHVRLRGEFLEGQRQKTDQQGRMATVNTQVSPATHNHD